MKILTLVENTSGGDVRSVHGLSFYVETAKHKLLFDLGPDKTVFENAKKLGVDLKAVDTVVISHGHYDHGGALRQFLEVNQTAKVYIQRSAFLPHYSKVLLAKIDIGLDKSLASHPQLVLLDGDYTIDDELTLFVSHLLDTFRSEANASLLSNDGPDDFRHEQNLLIRGTQDVLFMGCAHSGVLSILESVPGCRPQVCIGGFHIYIRPGAKPCRRHSCKRCLMRSAHTKTSGFTPATVQAKKATTFCIRGMRISGISAAAHSWSCNTANRKTEREKRSAFLLRSGFYKYCFARQNRRPKTGKPHTQTKDCTRIVRPFQPVPDFTLA